MSFQSDKEASVAIRTQAGKATRLRIRPASGRASAFADAALHRGARRVVLVFALGAALIAASLVGTQSGAAEPGASAARVIDQTLRCSIPRWAGNREITVWAQSGVRESPSRWKSLAAASIWTRGSQISLVQAAAGHPLPTESKGLTIFDTTLLIGEACRATTARVPLSARGLDGGAADAFGDAYKCPVSRTVLVHVRAVFRSSAFLRRDPRSGARITRTPVRTASLAIRTQSGRPVVFATVLESGKSRLFTAGGCG